MSRWLRLGLTDKLFVPLVGILLLSTILTTLLTTSAQNITDKQRSEQFTGRIRAQWITLIRELWGKGELQDLNHILFASVETDSLLTYAILQDSKGQTIAGTGVATRSISSGMKLSIPVTGPGGEKGVFIAGYAGTYTSGTSLTLIMAILIGGLSMIVVGALIYMKLLDKILLRRIRAASEAANAIANRDLTKKLDEKGEDELAALAHSFNIMVDNLKSLTKAIQRVVEEIDDETAGILASVDSQALLSLTQKEQVSQITRTMASMAELSNKIALSSGEVVKIADDTLKGSNRGVSATDDSRGLMDQIAIGNTERVEQIKDLKRRAIQIGDVMEFNERIADQTKLIAFNASIEAAGAGEMGRRFEVVAREIRRLAENVSESASQISTRITDIQQSIESIAARTAEESLKVQAGLDASLHTVTVLHSIREGANRTTEQVQSISVAIGNQNDAAGNLLTSLKVIDRQSGELNQGLSGLRFIAGALKGLSTSLNDISSSFRTGDDDNQNPSTAS